MNYPDVSGPQQQTYLYRIPGAVPERGDKLVACHGLLVVLLRAHVIFTQLAVVGWAVILGSWFVVG